MVEKIDEGNCGECLFYDPLNTLIEKPEETWGPCHNPEMPFKITYSFNTPRKALEKANQSRILEEFIKKDTTCIKIPVSLLGFHTLLLEVKERGFDETVISQT